MFIDWALLNESSLIVDFSTSDRLWWRKALVRNSQSNIVTPSQPEQRSGSQGADTEDIRVEERQIEHERLPVEARREVAETVGDLLAVG